MRDCLTGRGLSKQGNLQYSFHVLNESEKFFNRLLDLGPLILRVIQDRAVCAQLSHQHDAILRFLNRVFLGGKGELEVPITPVAGDTGTISTHDLVVDGIACQFKTMNNVSDAGVVTFLRKYLPAIRRNAARVPRWWLGYLRNINPPKSRKGHPRFIYLVLVEVAADRVLHAPNAVLETELISLVQQAQAKVKREDNIGDGFLLPVKNVWIVSQLKEELAEKEEAIAEKDKVIAAKDETIVEKDKVIAQREKEIVALKKRLAQ